MNRRSIFLLTCGYALASAACGGAITPVDPDDAGSPGSAASTPTLTAIDGLLCLPQPLDRGPDGLVDCVLVEAFPDPGDTCAAHGLGEPSAAILESAVQTFSGASVICELAQLAPSCEQSSHAGWCYIEVANDPGPCSQELRFSPSGTPFPGAAVAMTCGR